MQTHERTDALRPRQCRARGGALVGDEEDGAGGEGGDGDEEPEDGLVAAECAVEEARRTGARERAPVTKRARTPLMLP